MSRNTGGRKVAVASALAACAFLAVGCTDKSGPDGPSPEATRPVEITPGPSTVEITPGPSTVEITSGATASPEASPTGTSSEPSATRKAGLVVAKCEDEGVSTLFLAPRGSDQSSLVYPAKFADLCEWEEDLPTPLADTGVWRLVVPEGAYDGCRIYDGYWKFDEYKYSAC